jgi:hypothetical protein
VTDFLNTIRLLGPAGINGLAQDKVAFVLDPNTWWAAMDLPEIKTRDVSSNATVEKGQLKDIYGYPVMVSPFMHWKATTAGYERKANSAGKVDQDTQTNNLYGSLLAVRWDQWRLGWKRRMTIEVERFAASDSWQIVAMARWGLGYRDTDASAITYYVGV